MTYADRQALEPIMNVEISSPIEFQEAVVASINKKKGIIKEQDGDADYVTYRCEVSLNDMFGYASELRSLTQVRSNFNQVDSKRICEDICIFTRTRSCC